MLRNGGEIRHRPAQLLYGEMIGVRMGDQHGTHMGERHVQLHARGVNVGADVDEQIVVDQRA